ncbi:MAG: pyridoxamine 5'-phosphate oxidase family protein [Deltaproteobacteria bacterium]|nr:pyridoxamine 5'-phosphate oxidase family protein [Deltaproteobacteria bacterium]
MKVFGVWDAERSGVHLEQTVVPLRLASSTPDGCPLVVSLWFLWRDGALWCATQRSSRVASCIAREPRCGFEVAGDTPPYRGVRGQGRAEIVAERAEVILRALLRRYRGTEDDPLGRRLLSRLDNEVAIRIAPHWITSWDFTLRMSGGTRGDRG